VYRLGITVDIDSIEFSSMSEIGSPSVSMGIHYHFRSANQMNRFP